MFATGASVQVGCSVPRLQAVSTGRERLLVDHEFDFLLGRKMESSIHSSLLAQIQLSATLRTLGGSCMG